MRLTDSMTRLTSLVFCLATVTPVLGDINFSYAPGEDLYVRVRTSDTGSVAVALTEGTSNAAGFYRVTDASLVSAGLGTAGTYSFKVLVGATPSTSSDHPWVGHGVYRTNGSVEIPPESDITRWLGIALLAPNVPGLPVVDITHLLGAPVCD